MKFISALLLILACQLGLAQSLPNNKAVLILASAAQTAAEVDTTAQINNQWTGAQIVINVSAYTGGNYTPHVQGLDPFTGAYYDILVGSAISATGVTVLKVGRGTLAVPNAAAQDSLPLTWRVQMIGAATPSMTFSITANLGI